MRNKYTKEFENFVRKNASKYTRKELILLLENKFNVKLSNDALRRYLNRHKIDKYTDYKKYNVRDVKRSKIGAEKITKEGVFIKIAQPDIWRRKTRVMYEKYHNCKLTEEEYILFLNQNINDFRKENLVKITKKELAYLHNNKTLSSNPSLTKLALLSAKLMIKIKENE